MIGSSFGSYEFTEVHNDWPTGLGQVDRTGMKVYPNPFTGESRVSFHLANAENIILSLYNSTGQLVRSQDKGNLPAGDQECTIDARNLPAGIYMLKMQAGAQISVCKISVLN